MAAYAEGLNLLAHANAGRQVQSHDAETTPLRHPEEFQFDLNLRDVAEVWRRGSVIASWLLDLTRPPCSRILRSLSSTAGSRIPGDGPDSAAAGYDGPDSRGASVVQ